MRKAWLKYGGIVVIVMAVWIAAYSAYHFQMNDSSRGFMLASLLLIVGVSSVRKAKKLNHN